MVNFNAFTCLMQCNAIAEIKKYIVENLPGLSAFIVSVLSLWVSWMAYKRDDPKLDFNVYAAEMLGGTDLRLERTGLCISIANLGKNPVKLNSIGGDCKFYGFKLFVSRVMGTLTPKFLEPRAFLLDAIEISQYLRPSGDFIAIPPGDRILFMIQDPRGIELIKYFSKAASAIYIFDAVGNKYFLSKARFAKLKRDYKSKS